MWCAYEKQWLEKSRQRLQSHTRTAAGYINCVRRSFGRTSDFFLPSATIRSESTFRVGPGRLLLKRSLYCHDIIGQSPRRTPIINSLTTVSLLVAKSWKVAWVGVIMWTASVLNLHLHSARRLSVAAPTWTTSVYHRASQILPSFKMACSYSYMPKLCS